MTRPEIYAEIDTERAYQDAIWGADVDDKWSEDDWVQWIENYSKGIGRAEKYKGDFRTRMLKTAAICIAAIESLERQYNVPQ